VDNVLVSQRVLVMQHINLDSLNSCAGALQRNLLLLLVEAVNHLCCCYC
jgi:hypothetical protein